MNVYMGSLAIRLRLNKFTLKMDDGDGASTHINGASIARCEVTHCKNCSLKLATENSWKLSEALLCILVNRKAGYAANYEIVYYYNTKRRKQELPLVPP